MEDENTLKRNVSHEIGQGLDMLSIEEIGLRITLLKEEITRLEQASSQKAAVRQAAAGFFKS